MELPVSLPGLPLPPPTPAMPLAGRPSTDPRRIDQVAREFEAVFFSQLLKDMRQTLESDTLFPQDAGDVLGGLFDMFLGQHLAHGGALGIGALVKKQLLAMRNPCHNVPAPATPPPRLAGPLTA